MITDLILSVLAAPVSVANAYLLSLTLLSRRLPTRLADKPTVRFAVVVPAHNEEEGIAATIKSLLALDYPHNQFVVTVVADNCSDETAARAEKAGARVLVRHDVERRGKGYALAYAFERLAPQVDAIVVVDADTLV